MWSRLRSLNIADRRDVLLYVVLAIVMLGITIVWALFLSGLSIPIIGQPMFVWLLVIAVSLVAAIIPGVLWARNASRPRARFMVRLGLALEIFGLIITPVGLYYETNPVISVPIGFAAFLSVFFGVFIAGFGGNMIAPARA